MNHLRVEPLNPHSPEATELLAALDEFQCNLYPPTSTHLLPAAELARPEAVFLGAFADGQLVGCGGYVLHEGYAELKRMFVRPEARGHGLGKLLLGELERLAREAGVRILRLETGIRQPAAIRLYELSGYSRCGPYGDYTDDPLSVFMEKQLG